MRVVDMAHASPYCKQRYRQSSLLASRISTPIANDGANFLALILRVIILSSSRSTFGVFCFISQQARRTRSKALLFDFRRTFKDPGQQCDFSTNPSTTPHYRCRPRLALLPFLPWRISVLLAR